MTPFSQLRGSEIDFALRLFAGIYRLTCMALRSVLFFILGSVFLGGAPRPELAQIHTVYLLPMSGGLDQYLAVRITEHSLFQVVTDPAKADAVFTDKIGAGFEDLVKTLDAKNKPATTDDSYQRPTMSPLSRGRGSLFLVDRKTGNVVWSLYQEPVRTDPVEMSRLAHKIASRLGKDLKGK